MSETTIDVLRAEARRLIAGIETERWILSRWGQPDPLRDLSHMATQVADELHAVAAQTAHWAETFADPVPPLRLVHREEIAAEVMAGEHHDGNDAG